MIERRYIVGDCREKLRELPSESARCCVTSVVAAEVARELAKPATVEIKPGGER